MVDMSVKIAGVEFKNPVIAASGTFAFGEEYALYMDVSAIGGFALKALTREQREGNAPPRIAETPSGVLNAVGLQNPGVDAFIKDIYPRVSKIDTVQIANIAGTTTDDYLYVIDKLNDTDIQMFELNVSCPNVKEGGMSFGTDAGVLADIVRQAKQAAKKPLIVKLTPNVTSITEMAFAAKEGGADALSLINTVGGMAVNAFSRRPVMANVTGGLSGPAIKPVALKMVYEVYSCGVALPIIGMGGIMNGIDAAEFMIAGADAVMVGTATMNSPAATRRIADELKAFASEEKLSHITELTGSLVINN